MTELLKENKREFVWSLIDMLRFDSSVAIYKSNINPNAKKNSIEEENVRF